jgi:hypothetical protein
LPGCARIAHRQLDVARHAGRRVRVARIGCRAQIDRHHQLLLVQHKRAVHRLGQRGQQQARVGVAAVVLDQARERKTIESIHPPGARLQHFLQACGDLHQQAVAEFVA